MNLLAENKKYYFSVMLVEFVLLSCVYWYFFSFTFSSLFVYLLSASFYITGYRVWLTVFKRQQHLLFNSLEQFNILSFIMLVYILALNSLVSKELFLMSFIYFVIMIIFIAYYIFRIKKQKKSVIPAQKLSPTDKVLIIMCSIFLLFDFIVWNFNRMSLPLVLYLPVLFAILTLLLFIYKKEISFNSYSLFSFVLFGNIYILSSILLVLNYINNNFFTFMILIHFILFSSIFSLFTINSTKAKQDEFVYNKKTFLSLVFINIILIFISLNNILSFQMPQIFISYLYLVTILLITYVAYYNHKIFINIE